MGDTAVEAFRDALRAWSAQDPRPAAAMDEMVHGVDLHDGQLTAELLALEGPHGVRIATASLVAGRSLGRIADHSAIISARLRYLLTGDPEHLTEEVR